MIVDLDPKDVVVIQEALGEMHDRCKNELPRWAEAAEQAQRKMPWPVEGWSEITDELNVEPTS